MKTVCREEELGKLAPSLSQPALTVGMKRNYGSNLSSFYKLCESFLLNPFAMGLIDISRYIAWLGQRGT